MSDLLSGNDVPGQSITPKPKAYNFQLVILLEVKETLITIRSKPFSVVGPDQNLLHTRRKLNKRTRNYTNKFHALFFPCYGLAA